MTSYDYLNVPLESSYPTPLSNSTLLPLLLLSLASEKHTPDTLQNASQVRKEYDYVVVGAGAGGAVVAARLSEEPCVSVLLLEAGPPPPRVSDIPAVATSLWASNITWSFITEPQNHTAAALVDRKIPFSTGKTLGGSTTVNALQYVRGNKKDYDAWEAAGGIGWSYDEILPYFMKSENNQDADYVANGYHGTEGPVTISRSSYRAEIREPLFRAGEDLGYKFVDPNGPTQTGLYDVQAYLRGNRRCSTAKAYLVPAENRTNLDILPNALVTKVKIVNGTATGVSFDFDGQTYEVGAKREVILSAGTINTAKLLMLSGIGPKDELEKFNITVEADLPVGKNLQDHTGFPVFFVLNSSIPQFSKKLADEDNILQYIDNRTGPLASPSGVSLIAFLENNLTESVDDSPNYGIFFLEGLDLGLTEGMNIKPDVYQKMFGGHDNEPVMICYTHLLSPRSTGTVTLRSNNPYDTPVVDPNYLEHPQDVRDVVEAAKACRRIASNWQMSEVVSHILETTTPECEKYVGDEDPYLECTIRSLLTTIFHYTGIAKMGNITDPKTVVDPELKVKGINGLRVVDASIMPKVPSGHAATTTIMIGEKASDIIKKTINCTKDTGPFYED